MRKILLFLLSIFLLAKSYRFPNGHNLVINSSVANGHLSINMSSSSQDNRIEKFHFYCPQLTDYHHPNSITHGEAFFIVEPPIPKKKVVVNHVRQGENYLQIKHPFDYEKVHPLQHSTNFIQTQILSGNYEQDFLIPLMDKSLGFIPVHSLYHCRSILVSIDLSKGIQDITIFSRTTALHLEGKDWNWQLAKDYLSFHHTYYNRFTRSNLGAKIVITLGDQQCILDPEHIERSGIDIQQYTRTLFEKNISLEHLVRIVKEMPVFPYDRINVPEKGTEKDQQLEEAFPLDL